MDSSRNISLDLIKGFAIFLVVLGHLILPMAPHADTNPIRIFIWSIHMPLFFFVSGFLSYKRIYSLKDLCHFVTKKCKLLIPFFVFGCLMALLKQDDFVEFFKWEKYGMWFLWVLFLFFVIYSISNLLVIRFNNKYADLLILVGFVCISMYARIFQDTVWGGYLIS